ncbi:MAG TPA: DNA repair protein RecO [Chloroflexota bacterium]
MSERPRVYRTKGFVLKRMDLGEADKILTVYTPTFGKLKAIAKGVRRPSSRLGGHVDDFAYSDMMLAKGRDLDVVTQSQTLDSFRALREELWRTSYGYYVAELVDSFNEERSENEPLFDLLIQTFRLLASEGDLATVVRYFEMHMLDLVGYRPELQRCVRCRAEVQPEANFFSPSLGGVVCPECGPSEGSAVRISLNALKLLRYLQRLGGYPAGLKVDAATRRETETVMRGYLEHLLERSMKSTAFLDRLRHEDAAASSA